MVKMREFDLDYIEEAPQGERRRDIRIKNNKTREEADGARRMRLYQRVGRGGNQNGG